MKSNTSAHKCRNDDFIVVVRRQAYTRSCKLCTLIKIHLACRSIFLPRMTEQVIECALTLEYIGMTSHLLRQFLQRFVRPPLNFGTSCIRPKPYDDASSLALLRSLNLTQIQSSISCANSRVSEPLSMPFL